MINRDNLPIMVMSLKQLPRAYIFFIILAVILLAAGCESEGNDAPVAELHIEKESEVANTTRLPPATSTPTATQTPLPTATPTVTNTPSPTPTPTPTAIPINVFGDPRSALLSDPQPQDSARCGIVDVLDFPLDPPDALSVSYGGEGFGRFRGRYDQYHAGEDWQLTRGRTNLGVPVYAIGHGRVTYAQPLGWGRDQGVIIIRHTFEDGSTVLSFYGHMDPDSVILRAGDCVERGQKIAEIGQPRTPPHLHFEIRTHMPGEPGPGYWPVDPTEAGWLPPSQFIWNNRMASSPGVIWTKATTNTGLPAINLINDETVINISENQILGLNIADGQVSWQTTLTETVVSAALDQVQPLLYTADWSGQIAAYRLDDMVDASSSRPEAPFWQRDSRLVGAPQLHPLSGGGLVVSVREELLALSESGEVLWREELEQRPFDWLESSDRLLMTVSDRQGHIYSLDTSGFQVWPIPLKGRLVEGNDRLWLYAEEGLYLLDIETMDAELVHQLPPSLINIGSVVALPDGDVLIAHQEIGDSRLIAFADDGAVQWQRSYSQLDGRELRLLVQNNRPYLLMQSGSGLATTLELYALDIQDSTLRHIFTGGLRSSTPNDSWIINVNDDLILVDVGGSSYVALDPDTTVSLLESSAD